MTYVKKIMWSELSILVDPKKNPCQQGMFPAFGRWLSWHEWIAGNIFHVNRPIQMLLLAQFSHQIQIRLSAVFYMITKIGFSWCWRQFDIKSLQQLSFDFHHLKSVVFCCLNLLTVWVEVSTFCDKYCLEELLQWTLNWRIFINDCPQ